MCHCQRDCLAIRRRQTVVASAQTNRGASPSDVPAKRSPSIGVSRSRRRVLAYRIPAPFRPAARARSRSGATSLSILTSTKSPSHALRCKRARRRKAASAARGQARPRCRIQARTFFSRCRGRGHARITALCASGNPRLFDPSFRSVLPPFHKYWAISSGALRKPLFANGWSHVCSFHG